jgi:hypothetical protein
MSFLLGRRVRELPEVPDGAIPSDVVLRLGRFVPWLGGVLARMKGPAAAVTIGRTIVLNPEARLTPDLLTHELVHVRQWRQDLFFPIRYSLATLRYGYRNNPYEVEARSLATSEWPNRARSERT